MREIRMVTMILRRMFGKKAHNPLAGIRQKVKLMEPDESLDNFDAEDVSEFEADFMNVGMSHKMHEREMQSKKERLKQQIVIQKYFKEKEPRFLTFAENQLIHKLHKFNPDEWTAEKLSESFPALPETIRKILRVKWSPKSVKKVMQYDSVANKNWENFRAGKLPLNPVLSEHLMKFKDRKIILTNRESLAEQFVPKLEFKKPKSQLFSSIIQTYLDKKEDNMKLLPQENNLSKMTNKSDYSENQNLLSANTMTDSPATVKNTEKFALRREQSLALQSHTDSEKLNMPLNEKKEASVYTFDEFIKVKLKDIHQESPEEGTTLLNIHRKQMDASQQMQTAEVVTSDNGLTYTEDSSSKIVRQSDKDILIPSTDKNKDFNIVGADDNLLDTSVKVWKKKVDTELKYANPIKIAKHLYKPGMTYRISDCYYDDDGEFLYRVPGVYS